MSTMNPTQNQSLETTALLNNCNTTTTQKVTPLPYPQFYLLLIIRISEPLAFSILFPFIYFMVKDFRITDKESELGYFVGLIASCFAISQTLTSIPWGNLSDRIGRKPCIIFGLLWSGISLILFGLSKNLLWAILSRSLSGILNGNVGVVRTMVGELTDKSNRALAFSYLPMMFGLGNILGPIIGGFLADPATQLPEIFANEFWRTYKYFLPCLFAGLLNFCNAYFAYYYLEETLKRNTSDRENLVESSSSSNVETPAPVDNSIDFSCKVVIIGATLVALSAVMFNELIVLWSATEVSKGGLKFTQQDIAKALSSTGLIILFVQLVIYPRLQAKLGTLLLYRFTFPIYIVVCILIPMVNLIAKDNGSPFFMWSVLLFLLFFRAACNTLAVTSINILLVESAEGKGNLGKLNGYIQTFGSLARSVGPALTGTLYSYTLSNQFPFPFDFHFVWYILALVCLANYFTSFKIRNYS